MARPKNPNPKPRPHRLAFNIKPETHAAVLAAVKPAYDDTADTILIRLVAMATSKPQTRPKPRSAKKSLSKLAKKVKEKEEAQASLEVHVD